MLQFDDSCGELLTVSVADNSLCRVQTAVLPSLQCTVWDIVAYT